MATNIRDPSAARVPLRVAWIDLVWLSILCFTGLFQLFRGQFADGIIFLGVAAALVATARWDPAARSLRRSPAWVFIAVGAAAGLVLFAVPRHGLVSGITVAMLGLAALALAWVGRARVAGYSRPDAFRRTAILWSSIVVVGCAWELAAYLLGTATNRVDAPAISDLLDPLVETPIGHAAFILLWLAAGIVLLGRGRP